jgi:hypothetical protein
MLSATTGGSGVLHTSETCLSFFRNKLLRRILGLKREDGIGCWRILHNEKLYNSYPSKDILKVIKSRRT